MADPLDARYADAIEGNARAVESVKKAVAWCTAAFSVGPALLAGFGPDWPPLSTICLALAACNLAWGYRTMALLDARPAPMSCECDEERVDEGDPLLGDLPAAWARLLGSAPGRTAFYLKPSRSEAPEIGRDPEGVALIMPYGFLNLWHAPGEGRAAAEALLAHEAGHVVQNDLALWAGLRRAARFARWFVPLAVVQLAGAFVVVLWRRKAPGVLEASAQFLALWGCSIGVGGLHYAWSLGERALERSELMADHFAALSGGERGLRLAFDRHLREPSGDEHLSLALRRERLGAAPVSTPWADFRLALPTSVGPWIMLVAAFVMTAVAGYVHGTRSEARLLRGMLGRSEFFRRQGGTHVWRLESGGRTFVWDMDRADFAPNVLESDERLAGAADYLKAAVKDDPGPLLPLSVLALQSLPYRSSSAGVVRAASYYAFVATCFASGYSIGYAVGQGLDFDPGAESFERELGSEQTWRELQARLRFVSWWREPEWPPGVDMSPLERPWWLACRAPGGRGASAYPGRERLRLGYVNFEFDAAQYACDARAAPGAAWMRLVAFNGWWRRSPQLYPTGRPVEGGPLTREQLDWLVTLPGDVAALVTAFVADPEGCDSAAVEDLAASLEEPKRARFRSQLKALWPEPACGGGP